MRGPSRQAVGAYAEEFVGRRVGVRALPDGCPIYPERFAQEALGHNSKAVHRAYARKANVKLPSLETRPRTAKTTTKAKRKISAAGRARLAEAARKRWAAAKRAGKKSL